MLLMCSASLVTDCMEISCSPLSGVVGLTARGLLPRDLPEGACHQGPSAGNPV